MYQEFDTDGGGDVESDELLKLGQARRRLGQKSGEWTNEMNKKLMHKIGMDRRGNLPVHNFVDFFDGSLPHDRAEFELIIEQFMACAKACRSSKLQKREEEQAVSVKLAEEAAKAHAASRAKEANREKANKEAAKQAARRQLDRSSALGLKSKLKASRLSRTIAEQDCSRAHDVLRARAVKSKSKPNM